MNLKNRFRLIIFSMVVILISIAIIISIGIWHTKAHIQESDGMDELVVNLYKLQILNKEYLHTPSERVKQQWQAIYAKIRNKFVEQQNIPDDVKDVLNSLHQIFERITSCTEAASELDVSRKRLRNQLETTLNLESQRIIEWVSDISGHIKDGVVLHLMFIGAIELATVLVATLAVIAILLFSGRHFLSSVNRLKKGAEEIASGKLGFQVEQAGNDEIALLATAINQMSRSLLDSYEDLHGKTVQLETEMTERQIIHEALKIKTDELGEEIEEHRQAEEELRESENKFKCFAEQSFVGLYLIQDGVFQYVNPRFAQIFGYSVEECCKMHFRYLVFPEDLEKVEEQVRRRISVEVDFVQYKFRGIKKNREVIDVEIYGSSVSYKGKPAAIGTMLDITERKQAEEEKAKLEEQYRQAQKMEAIGQLAGGVAHDFNNMLNVILGYSQLALLKIEPSSPLNADLQEIMNATKRSTDLVRQLLAFARKQTIAPKTLDINGTVAGMLNMLRKLIGEDIDLLWMPAANVWPVKMDPTQIDQLLANLAVNARDSISGVGKITIETGKAEFDEMYCSQHSGFVPGLYVLLAVSDNGCGMDKETCEKIFEPFFTTKEIGKGTGMGLATVYGIVKQNNGFVNVYSEPGKGTAFKIYLPRHGGEEEVIDEPHAHPKTLTGTETVLLVEDNEALLKMAKIMLEELGYTVLALGNPNEAIQLAEQYAGDIHLLVTDIVMPEMSGRDLQKRLSALRPDMKYLFMSGYTANVIAHRGILDEGVNFLQKPFHMEELATKVREALDTP
ncbi:MAG: PAS domain S-box protein [Planctomycetota bacterium]